ncbi:MAG: hypothetical protein JWO42_3959 [Chloroflexi bacterium]|nr:hypothetical protein [Chloroflexota bacterium]
MGGHEHRDMGGVYARPIPSDGRSGQCSAVGGGISNLPRLSRSPMKPGTEARSSLRLGEDCKTVVSRPASFQVDRPEAASQTMARCLLLT